MIYLINYEGRTTEQDYIDEICFEYGYFTDEWKAKEIIDELNNKTDNFEDSFYSIVKIEQNNKDMED